MIDGKRIAVVMPAFNAEKTLEKTVREISDVVDIKMLVDDSRKDQTAELSRRLGVRTFVHDANLRLRAQPANLLSRGSGRWRRYCGDGPPRLPTRVVAGAGHGRHGGQQSVRYGAGIADSGRGGAQGRNAAL